MKVLLPISYLGPVSYYSVLLKYNEIFLETKEHFIKQSVRNRCSILGSNGVQILTIPKQRKSSDKTLISEIKISNKDNWQKSHWQSIVFAYNSSPFFEYYKDKLEDFYFSEYTDLFEFNIKITKTILSFLQEEKELHFTNEYNKKFDGPDFRESGFQIENIEKYEQVFSEKHDFTPNLSILDLLFNLGPETTSYLERQSI